MEDRHLPICDLLGCCEVCGRGLIHGDCVVCDLPLAVFGAEFSPELAPLRHREPITRISVLPHRLAPAAVELPAPQRELVASSS